MNIPTAILCNTFVYFSFRFCAGFNKLILVSGTIFCQDTESSLSWCSYFFNFRLGTKQCGTKLKFYKAFCLLKEYNAKCKIMWLFQILFRVSPNCERLFFFVYGSILECKILLFKFIIAATKSKCNFFFHLKTNNLHFTIFYVWIKPFLKLFWNYQYRFDFYTKLILAFSKYVFAK